MLCTEVDKDTPLRANRCRPMTKFIHTDSDLDAVIAALVKVDARFRADPCRGGPAAAAATRRRISGARRDRRVAAAFDRQRRRDLGTPRRRLRSVRSRRDPPRARGTAGAARPVGAENPHDEGNQPRRWTAARSISTRSASQEADDAPCRADGGARHRAMDRGYLSAVLSRPCRRVARGRSCDPGSDAGGVQSQGAPDREGSDRIRRELAALARRGGLPTVVLLSRRQGAQRRADCGRREEVDERQDDTRQEKSRKKTRRK